MKHALCGKWINIRSCRVPTARLSESPCLRNYFFYFMARNVTQYSIKVQTASNLPHLCCACSIKKKHLRSLISRLWRNANGYREEIYRALNAIVKMLHALSPKTVTNAISALTIWGTYFTVKNVFFVDSCFSIVDNAYLTRYVSTKIITSNDTWSITYYRKPHRG